MFLETSDSRKVAERVRLSSPAPSRSGTRATMRELGREVAPLGCADGDGRRQILARHDGLAPETSLRGPDIVVAVAQWKSAGPWPRRRRIVTGRSPLAEQCGCESRRDRLSAGSNPCGVRFRSSCAGESEGLWSGQPRQQSDEYHEHAQHWPVRLPARILGFHPGEAGAAPARVTVP